MSDRERFLKSSYCQKTDRPPVWLMRQAGRHLPEYLSLRDRHSFLEMLTKEELIAEISLQPWRRYQVDGVIVFSDILLLPKAMGMNLMFIEGQGPKFEKLIADEKEVANLKSLNPKKDIPFLLKGLKQIKKEIGNSAALIGFAGSPWTVASYMLQNFTGSAGPASFGAHPPARFCSGGIDPKLSPASPKLLKNLLKRLTQETIVYLQAQINAGVDVIQIFDSWGGVLSPADYAVWSGPYIKEIVDSLRGGWRRWVDTPRAEASGGMGPTADRTHPPIILYIKDSQPLIKEMLATGADVISVGWETPLEEAKKLAQGKTAIQGNLSPHILMQATPGEIGRQTEKMVETMKDYPGYIANLGHGVLPKTPVENVAAFVEAVRGKK